MPTPDGRDHDALLARALGEIRELRARVAASSREPIAIAGIGCRFPGADGPDAFWEMLQRGEDAISAVPADRPELAASGFPFGGFVGDPALFDAEHFGISAARGRDHRSAAAVAVGGGVGSARARRHRRRCVERRARRGVFVGICSNDYGQLLARRELEAIDVHLGTRARRTASPPAGFRTCSGCAGRAWPSTPPARRRSWPSTWRAERCAIGECDLALAGGVNRLLTPDLSVAFATRADARRRRPLQDVRRRGGRVRARRRVRRRRAEAPERRAARRRSHPGRDPRHGGQSGRPEQRADRAERPRAAGRDPRSALARRGACTPHDVGYVEAHGTGTRLGDPIEVNALAAVFSAAPSLR